MIGQFATGTGARCCGSTIYAGALFYCSGSWPSSRWWPPRSCGGWPRTSPRLVKDVSRERSRRAGSLSAVTEERYARVRHTRADLQPRDQAASRTTTGRTSRSRAPSTGQRAVPRGVPCLWPTWPSWSARWPSSRWARGRCATDRLTLGGLMAFLALLVQCYSPLRTWATCSPRSTPRPRVSSAWALLDEPLPQEAPGARDLVNVRGAVKQKWVRYPGADPGRARLVVRVEAGEMVGLVGASGPAECGDPAARPTCRDRPWSASTGRTSATSPPGRCATQ